VVTHRQRRHPETYHIHPCPLHILWPFYRITKRLCRLILQIGLYSTNMGCVLERILIFLNSKTRFLVIPTFRRSSFHCTVLESTTTVYHSMPCVIATPWTMSCSSTSPPGVLVHVGLTCHWSFLISNGTHQRIMTATVRSDREMLLHVGVVSYNT
jgi:hypothetical protein